MPEALVVVGSIAAATLFGSMFFFSSVVAPRVFINLEPTAAGRFIRSLFPWYYLSSSCWLRSPPPRWRWGAPSMPPSWG